MFIGQRVSCGALMRLRGSKRVHASTAPDDGTNHQEVVLRNSLAAVEYSSNSFKHGYALWPAIKEHLTASPTSHYSILGTQYHQTRLSAGATSCGGDWSHAVPSQLVVSLTWWSSRRVMAIVLIFHLASSFCSRYPGWSCKLTWPFLQKQTWPLSTSSFHQRSNTARLIEGRSNSHSIINLVAHWHPMTSAQLASL